MHWKTWGILIAVLSLASSAHAATHPQHVRASLLADVTQIVPGKPFHLGIKLDIDPGWHVYWLNPGDSGSATKIKLDLPKGFAAGDVQFPTPIKMVDPGNINVYGYTNSVMFIATVTADKSLPAGEADLSAKVSYLVCNDLCIPGHATVDLKLPIAAVGGVGGEANQQLFAQWLAELPANADTALGVADFQQTLYPTTNTVRIAFKLPASSSSVVAFPGPNEDVDVKAKSTMGKSATIENIEMSVTPLSGRAMPEVMLPVVIGFDTPQGRRGIITQIDLSKLKSADSKPPQR